MLNERVNFYYDPAREGYDTTLWKTVTGVPSVVSDKIRLNTAKIVGYADIFKGEVTYKLAVPAAPVSANLVSGAAAEIDYTAWEAVTDGEFAITVDGTAYDITGIDFTGVANMSEVAAAIQTAIRAKTSGTETCVWSAVLTGGTAATSTVATWAAVVDGEFAITIDGTAIEVASLDFSSATTMDDVAAVIQAGIRGETGGTETVEWDTDHFIVTALNSVSVTSTVAAPAGTDISGAGATTFMDSETAVGTATNIFTITSTTAITVASAVVAGAGTDISGAGAGAFLDADTGNGTAIQGSDREFGLEQLGGSSKLTFKIAGDTLTCEALYEGVSSSTSVDWDTAWTAVATDFTIKWTGFSAEFLIGGVQKVFLTDTDVLSVPTVKIPKKALSQMISNASADNMDITIINVNNVQGYI